jgi:hypothetical protein
MVPDPVIGDPDCWSHEGTAIDTLVTCPIAVTEVNSKNAAVNSRSFMKCFALSPPGDSWSISAATGK